MSTTSTIQISDDEDTFFIYRHSDGYPWGEHGVPATLAKAIPFAWELPRFEAMDFAAAIVRAWKEGGGNIYFTKGHDNHADSEFQYTVTFGDDGLRLKAEDVGFAFDNISEEERRRETMFEGPLDEAIEFFREQPEEE